jgi:two-component system sensor histidine kinase MprB
VSLTRRFSVASAGVVLVTLGVAGVCAYLFVRALMMEEVDRTLRERIAVPASTAVLFKGSSAGEKAVPATKGDKVDAFELRLPDAVPIVEPVSDWLIGVADLREGSKNTTGLITPLDAKVRAVAEGSLADDIRTMSIEGASYRIATSRFVPDVVLQTARPLAETERVLSRLVWILVGIALAAALVAGLAGRIVARAVLAPVRQLAAAAQHVAATRDLRRRVPDEGAGELAQLAKTFNTMLAALDDSQRAQRQLVIDASHELRTPVASARTNLEVLRHGRLSDEERDTVIDDVVAQLDELGTTIADVVELARSEAEPPVSQEVRLDELVRETVDRVQVHAGGRCLQVNAAPCVVHAPPDRLGRAVRNLLDNALKWGPLGKPIEVEVAAGELRVRDHGPGVAPEHLPHVFDRFWRAPSARSLPGSGLGLAIVSQVASELGGSVTLEPAAGGGTLARLSLPWREVEAAAAVDQAPVSS